MPRAAMPMTSSSGSVATTEPIAGSRHARRRSATSRGVVKWLGTNTDIQDSRDAQDSLSSINQELEARVEARTRDLSQAHDALASANSQLAAAQRIAHVGSCALDLATGAVTARGEAVDGADGRVSRVLGTAQDVTDLERVTRELERAWERIRLAADAAAMGIWDWNIRDDVLVWASCRRRARGPGCASDESPPTDCTGCALRGGRCTLCACPRA